MNRTSRDLLSSPWWTGVLFCLPIAVIALSGNLGMTNQWQAVTWAICLGVMAAGCLVNAIRCGRTHCYFTGPFLLLMSLASLWYGFGGLSLGMQGWNWIGGVTLVGATLLYFFPEHLLGRYRKR